MTHIETTDAVAHAADEIATIAANLARLSHQLAEAANWLQQAVSALAGEELLYEERPERWVK